MDIHLYYKAYTPEEDPKAVVFVVHGMQEHKERYDAFAKKMNENDIACILYDLPGHGMDCPDEDLGWFGAEHGWDNLVNSAVEITRLAHEKYPSVPVFFFGHSMGTMIGRTYLQNHDDLIDGMILSGAPNYQPAAVLGLACADIEAKKKGKKGHSKLLDQMATGTFNSGIKNPRTPLDWLSYNEDNVDTYIADKYCGFPFTIQGYHDLFEGMIRMHDINAFKMNNKDLPIWLFAGEDDPCRGKDKGFKDSADTLRKAGYQNVQTSLYPYMRHETLNEQHGDAVMQNVADWILAHC